MERIENIYDLLYRSCACPAMKQTECEHQAILESFVHSFPKEEQITAYDLVSYIRTQWGLEAFKQGVRLGMELFYAPGRESEDYQILIDFLTKLNQPLPGGQSLSQDAV